MISKPHEPLMLQSLSPFQGTQEIQEQTVKQLLKQLQPSNIENTVDYLIPRPSIPHKCQEQLNETIEIVCSNMLENIEFVELEANSVSI